MIGHQHTTSSLENPESSRQRRQRETRQALLDAAYQSFCEFGYASCSLELIASRAGFTKGALYGHFASKEDLFLALTELRTESLLEVWATVADERTGRDSWRHSFGQWLGAAIRDQRDWMLVNTEFAVLAARKPNLALHRRETLHRASADLAAILRGQGLNADETETAGRLMLALVDGLGMQAVIDPELDLDACLTRGLELLTTSSAAR